MKTDDRKASARREELQRRRKTLLKLTQLIVDEHAERLERASRRMLTRLARTNCLRNNRRELTRANDRMLLPLFDD